MRHLIFIGIISMLLFSCKSKKATINAMEEMDESQTSSLFEEMESTGSENIILGTYSGMLPCADCIGIQVEITFRDDNSYLKRSKYLGKSTEILIEKGTFNYDEFEGQLNCSTDSGIIASYEVEENRLVLINQQNDRQNNLEELYTLYKNNGMLTNRLWTAVEIDGQKIKTKTATLIFRNDNMLSGTGGCNQLHGNFEIEEKARRIKFGTLAMTKMACQHKHYDDELAQALHKSKYFFINKEGQLKLVSKEEEVLAVFEGSSLK